MNKRIIAVVIPALLAACGTENRSAALTVQKIVLGTQSGTGPTAACVFSVGGNESDLPIFDPQAVNQRAATGFVINNQLTNTSSLNTVLRTNTNNFTPHQAVVDYEIIGGATLPQQIVPISSGTVVAGTLTAVIVPLFAPTAVLTAVTGLAANTFVRTSTRIEGKLDDGTTVSTSQHEYVVEVCPGCGNTPCF